MIRVPNSGPAERERQHQIRRLEKALRRFERVPAHRRDAECADEGERDVRQFLAELGAPGFPLPEKPVATVMVLDLDNWLAEHESHR